MKTLYTCENFNIIEENDQVIYLVDGWGLDDDGNEFCTHFGILQSDLRKYLDKGLMSQYAQFFGLVVPGLILTKHIFAGLQRPLYCDDSMEGDKDKLIHTRRPSFDCAWAGGCSGDIVELKAPDRRIFAIIISRNVRHKETYPSVHGWIDRWNWVEEDSYLPEAPINWVDRFQKKLYTRKAVI